MTAMAMMNISLPDTMRTFVEEEMNQSGYMSASEFVRALVRERQRARAQERFEALILEGVQSGPGVPLTPEIWANLESKVLSDVEEAE